MKQRTNRDKGLLEGRDFNMNAAAVDTRVLLKDKRRKEFIRSGMYYGQNMRCQIEMVHSGDERISCKKRIMTELHGHRTTVGDCRGSDGET